MSFPWSAHIRAFHDNARADWLGLFVTVGATSDFDRVTDYSTYGSDTQRKPDLVAPGGSLRSGRKLVTVDTNFADPDGVSSDSGAAAFPWPR